MKKIANISDFKGPMGGFWLRHNVICPLKIMSKLLDIVEAVLLILIMIDNIIRNIRR